MAEIIHNVSKDCYLSSRFATTKYGTNATLKLGVAASSNKQRSLLEFDLGVWVKQVIGSALLQVFWTASPPSEHAAYWSWCNRRGSEWVESEATWNERKSGMVWVPPGGEIDVADQVSFDLRTELAGFLSYDITLLARRAVNETGGLLSLIGMRASESGEGKGVFAAKEHGTEANRPVLIVNGRQELRAFRAGARPGSYRVDHYRPDGYRPGRS